MTDNEYDQAMRGFKSGLYRGIVNVDMLTTGYDNPSIDAIFVARAMMSLALWYQIVGRGTRIDPTGIKKDCVIVDYCGNVDRFGPVEDLECLDIPGYGWGMFGAGGKLLTGIRMDGSEMYAPNKPFTKYNCSELAIYRKNMYRTETA